MVNADTAPVYRLALYLAFNQGKLVRFQPGALLPPYVNSRRTGSYPVDGSAILPGGTSAFDDVFKPS